MPDLVKAEERTIRTNSVGIVVTSDQSRSFASCPTCPGPNRTPTLHADQCMSVDSTQGVKALSSSTPVENQDNYPLCKLEFNGITLGESATEPSNVIHGVIGVPADGTASADVAAPESLNPGSPVLNGKRNAAATEDGPESKAKRKATIEAYSGSKESLEKRKQRIFQDLPDSSGRVGSGMSVLGERWDAPELSGNQLMDHIVPQRAPLYAPPFATVQTPGFSYDFSSQTGGIIPFTDERLIYDPDRVGLERLNVLSRANGAEILYGSLTTLKREH